MTNQNVRENDASAMKKKRPKMNFKVLGRTVKMLFQFYPRAIPLTIVCIVFSSVVSAIPAVWLQQVTDTITDCVRDATPWSVAAGLIIPKVVLLVVFYLLSVGSMVLYTQMSAVVTQGFLNKMRQSMFSGMQNLPIKYFDTHKHGDIMSYYINDLDTLRELISQTFVTLIRAGTIVFAVLFLMLYYSFWLTLVVVLGVVLMTVVSGVFGGGSARYFMRLQKTFARLEGYIQEMMNGQKVIKVFNHEKACQKGFDDLNDELFAVSFKANACANMLGPVIMNIGNLLYVAVAVLGCVLLINKAWNPSIAAFLSGSYTVTVGVVVSFLGMTKQFTGNVNQVSQQINGVVMAMAGAERIFGLIDEKPEIDDGYVTLVNVVENADGSLSETDAHTGKWAWKHPHSADGSVTYTPLRGDVVMTDVDFGYEENKTVLHNVSVYAEPGQKVAFVGATGAGKTTITNLINRFYDIDDGKIRYDGINVNKIKKNDLRRSLGLVLQDTNLFTGTVMENIRYGKLDATDEECVHAAKLAGADDFISRLPEGYDTLLTGNGANLSQGQRQLLAIARCAVADPPVMILDEATSSIDTRTEAIVQKGMDALMKGRTTFVIAHRLSTVRNADVIMVLDHGKIIERGNHEKLIAEKGQYYQLYTGAFELE